MIMLRVKKITGYFPWQNIHIYIVHFMPVVKRKSLPVEKKINQVRLIAGGKAYFELLVKLIDEAKESIHLQAYIFDDDETGICITNALKAAVKRNVSVHLLADGYASQALPDHFVASLKEAGINFRFFEPVFKNKNFYFGRRMHHKIFVADTRVALTGGINISNNYNDLPGKMAWLDFALYAEGEIARDLCVLCWKTWNDFTAEMSITPCEEKKLVFNFSDEEKSTVGMRRNDWVRRKNEISGTYINMFLHAKSHIIIMCSYFLPGKIIRRLLKDAAKRGVKIKVIVAGISDVAIAKYAERWMYDWLLRNNIELYEYQPTVLHAKIAVCDSEWLTVGSYNINNISAYASIELNLDVYNAAIALQTENKIEQIIKNDCLAITREMHKRSKNIFVQFIRWSSYQFIRLTFYLFTFYFKHKD
jgi:cardiolipin synthase